MFHAFKLLQDKVEALEKDREQTKRVLTSMGNQYSDLKTAANSGDSLIKVADSTIPPVSFETKSLFDSVPPPVSRSPYRVHSVSPPRPITGKNLSVSRRSCRRK
jgi:hypothetical protein